MTSNKLTSTPNTFEKLMEKYPVVFQNLGTNMEAYIPAGWYTLMDSLCADLHEMLSEELMNNPDTKEMPLFIVDQIKEKYGGLRFYYYVNSDNRDFFKKIQTRIDKAEDDSYSTCEVTGNPGVLCKNGSHFSTLCEACRKERGYKEIGKTT